LDGEKVPDGKCQRDKDDEKYDNEVVFQQKGQNLSPRGIRALRRGTNFRL
jgi:hypothetical protein